MRVILDEGEKIEKGKTYMVVGIFTTDVDSWITCRPFKEMDKERIFAAAKEVEEALDRDAIV